MVTRAQILTCFGLASAAGFALASTMALRLPEPGRRAEGPVSTFSYDQAAICTATREDMPRLLSGLSSAPFMSLEVVETLTKSYLSLDPRPVLEIYDEDESLRVLKWLDKDGKPHRLDGPALTVFDPLRRRVVMDIWARHGLMHREGDLPATTEWDEEGRVKAQTWRKNDLLHNEGGSAYRSYDWKNDTITQGWYLNGDIMRPGDGPTYTDTLISSGLTVLERWESRRGMSRLMHRADGLHIVEHDRLTSFQTRKLYRFHDGETHTDEMTYEIQNDGGTGIMRREEWKKNGALIGAVDYDKNGRIIMAAPAQAHIDSLRRLTQTLIASGGHHQHNHHNHHDHPHHHHDGRPDALPQPAAVSPN